MQFIIFREIWERMEEEDIDAAKEELVSNAKKLKVYFFLSAFWDSITFFCLKKDSFGFKR
jgi:hypothetical protein